MRQIVLMPLMIMVRKLYSKVYAGGMSMNGEGIKRDILDINTARQIDDMAGIGERIKEGTGPFSG